MKRRHVHPNRIHICPIFRCGCSTHIIPHSHNGSARPTYRVSLMRWTGYDTLLLMPSINDRLRAKSCHQIDINRPESLQYLPQIGCSSLFIYSSKDMIFPCAFFHRLFFIPPKRTFPCRKMHFFKKYDLLKEARVCACSPFASSTAIFTEQASQVNISLEYYISG